MNKPYVPTTGEALQLILDSVDYTDGACSLNEMVGAVLPKRIIELAKAAIVAERAKAGKS